MKFRAWDTLSISAEELETAELNPRCIVKDYLYADTALLISPGGVGKTTQALMEMIHIALGLPLYGLPIESPGPCLLITAEDKKSICVARFRELIKAMNLDDEQRAKAMRDVAIMDVSGEIVRLCELDKSGNIVLTPLTENICKAYADKGLSLITFDPVIKFGAGERLVNDNEEALVTAARRIVKATDACVRFICHTGKENARNQVLRSICW